MGRKLASRVRRAVIAPSGPWWVLDAHGKPTTEETGINLLRQVKAVEECRDKDAELLIVSGRDEEMDMLELMSMKARQVVQFRPCHTVMQRGAYNTFLNAYHSLEMLWRMDIREGIVVSSPYHLQRLRLVFAGILAHAERRMGWTVRMRFVACETSTVERVAVFEQQLAMEENAKCGWEERTLEGYVEDLRRWRRKEGHFLPYPSVVKRQIPPASRARVASESRRGET